MDMGLHHFRTFVIVKKFSSVKPDFFPKFIIGNKSQNIALSTVSVTTGFIQCRQFYLRLGGVSKSHLPAEEFHSVNLNPSFPMLTSGFEHHSCASRAWETIRMRTCAQISGERSERTDTHPADPQSMGHGDGMARAVVGQLARVALRLRQRQTGARPQVRP